MEAQLSMMCSGNQSWWFNLPKELVCHKLQNHYGLNLVNFDCYVLKKQPFMDYLDISLWRKELQGIVTLFS